MGVSQNNFFGVGGGSPKNKPQNIVRSILGPSYLGTVGFQRHISFVNKRDGPPGIGARRVEFQG